eukprot:CAMPEP_0170549108 /NCGR_PEP_ID=MMETSP0211-20121228/7301_1 /TAXON_ID=311385 /ORGANISM="Pseudokeronopsis sp., Strain OXSARD2" /LENGTH=92 /DNA_ID=CAMNT_0010854941 /DNA_START=59 /DNA_END=337 /DNA_ORIENTATION=-
MNIVRPNVWIRSTFPPANWRLVEMLGADPVPSIEEDSIGMDILVDGTDFFEGTLESFEIDEDDNQIIEFSFSNPTQNRESVRVTYHNVRLPF